MDNMNILIYDDKEIKYYFGYTDKINTINNPEIIDVTEITDLFKKTEIINNTETHIICDNFIGSQYIKLDETLMKRIAKYNKEKELEEIDYEIKEKQCILKELFEDIKEKEKQLSNINDKLFELKPLKKALDDLIYDEEDDYWED